MAIGAYMNDQHVQLAFIIKASTLVCGKYKGQGVLLRGTICCTALLMAVNSLIGGFGTKCRRTDINPFIYRLKGLPDDG